MKTVFLIINSWYRIISWIVIYKIEFITLLIAKHNYCYIRTGLFSLKFIIIFLNIYKSFLLYVYRSRLLAY